MKLNAILLFSLFGLGLATPVTTDDHLAARGDNADLNNDGSFIPHPKCDANGQCPQYFGCRNGYCYCLPYHPYRDQLKQRRIHKASDLTPDDREKLDRLRQPAAERVAGGVVWLRTCYEPSTDAAFSAISVRLNQQLLSPLNDASLYDFGADWYKIFLRMPQLLEHFGSAEEYKESVQEALRQGMEWEAEDPAQAEEEGYDPEEDGLPWPMFYAEYHRALVIGRIHIVDKKTLASEGRDAGKVLIVFYDECGRVVRSARADEWYAADITYLDNCYLDEHGCWVNGRIGKDYDWGGPLGPPYGEDGEDEADESGDE
ncbi:uncharacterized protein CDV56_109164 [Aspergillus thermomutatus]|uniref:Uncharacterized protein n=1 Tax=Aspergillus thermomutatus TaxID=41047 RepID=A0A397HWP5_ASPTH|nr:uncharacterized protein CDV56_109164 [Aspergillus thermomutatus]RHZ65986.1 hypothetical protein CDV56_109164 [Aspergillus thermomutatus]